MKKQITLILILLFASQLFSQEIKVLQEEKKEATILNFTTTNNKQVPIYRPMGEMDFDSDNERIILRKIQLLGSAPLSLEVEQGYYTFQLYETGPQFSIDAQGGTQDWMIKPGSENYGYFGGAAIGSWMFASISGMVFGFNSDTSSQLYDENLHMASGICFGAFVTTAVITTVLYFRSKPKAKLVKTY